MIDSLKMWCGVTALLAATMLLISAGLEGMRPAAVSLTFAWIAATLFAAVFG